MAGRFTVRNFSIHVVYLLVTLHIGQLSHCHKLTSSMITSRSDAHALHLYHLFTTDRDGKPSGIVTAPANLAMRGAQRVKGGLRHWPKNCSTS